MKALIVVCFIFSLPGWAREKNMTKPATKPDEVIQVGQKDLEIIRRALALLKTEKNWNRKDTRDCPPGAATLSLYCALYKASEEITGEFDHRSGALEEVRRTIEVASKGKAYEHRLMGYNNDTSTIFSDIKKVLEMTEARILKKIVP